MKKLKIKYQSGLKIKNIKPVTVPDVEDIKLKYKTSLKTGALADIEVKIRAFVPGTKSRRRDLEHRLAEKIAEFLEAEFDEAEKAKEAEKVD